MPVALAASSDAARSPGSLRWLLHGLHGRELQVVVAPEHAQPGQPAPPQRPVLAPDRLLLPHGIAAQGTSASAIGRASIAHAVAHLRYSVPARPVDRLKPMSIAVISALEDARVERLLAKELPGVRGWFKLGMEASGQTEDLSFAGLMVRLDRALADPCRVDGNFWVEKARDLFESQAAADLHDYAAFRRIGSVLANDLGQLRVPFRSQQYVVPTPYRDDHGYLWQFPESPDPPLSVASTSPAPEHDLSAAPSEKGSEGAELELARFCYPEWDERAGIQRDDWTTVLERRPAWRIAPPPRDPGQARARLALRMPQRVIRTNWRRVFEGEHLDLNAAVDTMVALRSSRLPEARLFRAAAPKPESRSVLVLLDLSQSTNDSVGAEGPSLLALERTASLMLANALGGARALDRLAIHGFHSDGRDRVVYYRMLDFGQILDDRARAMITQAPGRYSTRMGSALRHATRCLAGERADRRALLLVTDGAPSDIDVHTPRYLVEDARAAVFAARRAGVRVHALAVDTCAENDVRRIFGSRGYDVVDRAAMLPVRLRDAYWRLGHT
jgi:nitric oxide reductase NorD protein